MPLSLRAWLRYVVPLTVLSALALLPLVWIASRAGLAKDLAQARAQVRLGWVLGACALACQLWLVAAVAPVVRGLHAAPLSQLGAFVQGLRGLVRGLIPAVIAIIAVALGGVALVVPGLLLLVLLALTGASTRLAEPPPAPLLDSVTVVRNSFARVALLVGAILAVNLAVVLVLQWQLVPNVTRKVPAAKLAPIRAFVRAVPLALIVLSPLAACALAAAYERLSLGKRPEGFTRQTR